tara:strand:+ start:2724 stop:3203 length:480 start_codon:yes stop_codon:yes gene_type:complete
VNPNLYKKTKELNMRLLLLLALLPLSQLHAQSMSTIAKNCEQWSSARQNQSEQATLYWLEGFVSAYNKYEYKGSHPEGVLHSVNPKIITGWLDGYCLSNLESSPQIAVESFIDEKKLPVKACAIKKSSGRPCIPYEEDLPEDSLATGSPDKKIKWRFWK